MQKYSCGALSSPLPAYPVACWHLECSFTEGRVTCGASRCGTTMERKVELLIAKLKNYNMSIAGIQETKWFGSDFWPCGEWTSLHSGSELPLPPDGIICTRRNGVGSVSLPYSIFPHLSNSSPRNSSPTVQQNSRICW